MHRAFLLATLVVLIACNGSTETPTPAPTETPVLAATSAPSPTPTAPPVGPGDVESHGSEVPDPTSAVAVAVPTATATPASASTATATPASTGTNLALYFADGDGAAIDHIVLGETGDSAVVQVHASGLNHPNVNVAQVSIRHDESQVSIAAPVNEPLCDGIFEGAFSASGRTDEDGATWFVCGITGTVGLQSGGHVMNLEITRVSASEPELTFSSTGLLPTRFFEPNVSYDPDELGSIKVLLKPR